MPDDERLKPGTDTLMKGVSEAETNRARRISSLTNRMNELVQKENQKRLQMSTEISSLTKKQQDNMKSLEMSRADFTNQTTAGFNKVIKGLGDTISSLASGVKNITKDTALASANAVSQYGKAISEDISINKTNTIAMALSRATPLFGYFAAKFMETDVFKNAATKIREHVGASVKRGLSAVGSLFRRNEEKERLEVPHGQKIKQLQQGGMVTKGGVVEVHAAEIIAPVDKLMHQMILANSKVQQENTKTIIQTFMEEYQGARKVKGGPWQERLVKSIDELKVGMLGMASRFRIAMTRTLLRHPTFRSALMASQLLKRALTSPLKFFFGARGGYAGDVRQAMSTSNVTMKTANLLALIYTKGQPRLDEISHYTRITAKAVAGDAFSEAKIRKGATRFQKIRQFMTTRKIGTGKGALFKSLVSSLGLDEEALKEAGITKIRDFARIIRISKSAGVTPKGVWGKLREKQPKEASMEQNIAITAKHAKEGSQKSSRQRKKAMKQREKQSKKLTKIRKVGERGNRLLGRVRRRLKKMGGGIVSIFMSLLGFLGKMGSGLLNMFGGAGKFALILGPFIAKAILVGIAGIVGAVVGTVLNKLIVNPIVKWIFGIEQKKLGESKKEISEMLKAGQTQGAAGKSFIVAAASIQAPIEAKRKALGVFGGSDWGIQMIQDAQTRYANKHMNEYASYAPAEIRRVRRDFLKNKGFRGKYAWDTNEGYGQKREAAFLKYLQSHGTTVDEMGRSSFLTKGEIASANARGRTGERKALAGDLQRANQTLAAGQEANTAAIVQNTTAMSNTNVNTANTTIGGGGGGLGSMGTASSGGLSADRVAMSTLD